MYQGYSVDLSWEVVSFCQEEQMKFLMESESLEWQTPGSFCLVSASANITCIAYLQMAIQLSQYSEKERLGSKDSLVCGKLRLLNTEWYSLGVSLSQLYHDSAAGRPFWTIALVKTFLKIDNICGFEFSYCAECSNLPPSFQNVLLANDIW